MSKLNSFSQSTYNNYRIGLDRYPLNHSTIPFPKINYKNMYDDGNQDKKEIKHQNEDNKMKLKTKRCRKLFTKDEDEKIKELTEKYGTKQWNIIAQFIDGRTPKQCRDRYCNYLFPGIFNGEWSNEEDELLIDLYKRYGPRWTTLQRSFPYRSANTIKNRWDFFLCRHLTDKKKETINDKSKDYDIKQKEDNKTKNTAKNQKSSNLSLRNKKEDNSSLFDLIDDSYELIQEDNIFEPTNYWYEYY